MLVVQLGTLQVRLKLNQPQQPPRQGKPLSAALICVLFYELCKLTEITMFLQRYVMIAAILACLYCCVHAQYGFMMAPTAPPAPAPWPAPAPDTWPAPAPDSWPAPAPVVWG